MTPPRARIIRASSETGAARTALLPLQAGGAQRRRIAREEIEARLAAEHIVDEARSRADAMAHHARDQARSAAALGACEAEEQAEAKVAARWLALRQAEGRRLEGDAERIIAIGVALAERLLGTALELDPVRIADLARTALAEARGAHRVAIDAHPSDAAALRLKLSAAGFDTQTVEVREDETLAHGDLRLQTEVGTIDAKLAPRLERLAAALRDAIP